MPCRERLCAGFAFTCVVCLIFMSSNNFTSMFRPVKHFYVENDKVKNVTAKNCKLVVYNRVPKCGSTTLLFILHRLAVLNNFDTFHSIIFDEQLLSKSSQIDLLMDLQSQLPEDACLVYDRHLYFINFENLGFEQPTYINLVRHPVEREISNFHYLRSEKHMKTLLATGRELPSPAYRDLTIEQAVLEKALSDYNVTDGDLSTRDGLIPYFCGQRKLCLRHNYQPALQLAKSNIESHFSVVGVLEDLATTLQVFQFYLPRIFGNITSYSYATANLVKNSNYHENAKSEVKKQLKDYLHMEIDLYHFIKQRLQKQRDQLFRNGHLSMNEDSVRPYSTLQLRRKGKRRKSNRRVSLA